MTAYIGNAPSQADPKLKKIISFDLPMSISTGAKASFPDPQKLASFGKFSNLQAKEKDQTLRNIST